MDMSCLPQVGGGSPNAAEGATESPLTPSVGFADSSPLGEQLAL
jgi:hypothetical protein